MEARVTVKEKILALIQGLPDDVSIEQAIDRLHLLQKIETGIAQADAEDVFDHDALFDELLG